MYDFSVIDDMISIGKKIVYGGVIVGLAATAIVFLWNSDDKCWSKNYGECQESLDWEEESSKHLDVLCQTYTEMYCDNEISEKKYKSLVENLTK